MRSTLGVEHASREILSAWVDVMQQLNCEHFYSELKDNAVRLDLQEYMYTERLVQYYTDLPVTNAG
ncbi:hypothetical protein GBBBJNDB_00344 [Pseudomonas phage Callisto]|uniref:Uncharacterized protein n=1 Tax=Pseudomonas phage vB_PaeM_PA5oct TaxID=2163605 RepID=A0A4Y5JU24_9CAUD|nr:hypothetical protein PQE65_gp405 [Pseudomonas phage vB_PaeM_PA5oct]QCG75960.1 hypothetical protein EST35_0078 [Pseudomonas phage vB_PaeM_PA5oct]WMI32035.1 hypothetical protein GBBBJNDB_00344 [Pseudomonas phage Callisto]WPK39553.1 hypothetical protein Deiofobo_0356 [Pseudomonas phage Deifobo]WPK40588.1 hypothetical protein Paride_0358 [Pseudomonas phage Paride]